MEIEMCSTFWYNNSVKIVRFEQIWKMFIQYGLLHVLIKTERIMFWRNIKNGMFWSHSKFGDQTVIRHFYRKNRCSISHIRQLHVFINSKIILHKLPFITIFKKKILLPIRFIQIIIINRYLVPTTRYQNPLIF